MPILITLKKLSPMSYCLIQRIFHKIAYVISTKRLLNAIYMEVVEMLPGSVIVLPQPSLHKK